MTAAPVWAKVALQPCWTFWPSGNVQPTCQLSSAAPSFRSETLAVNPVSQSLVV